MEIYTTGLSKTNVISQALIILMSTVYNLIKIEVDKDIERKIKEVGVGAKWG